jgi:hypothetical protein
MPETAPRYAFDNAWVLAERRLTELERLLDPGSLDQLSHLGVGPGLVDVEAVGACSRSAGGRPRADHRPIPPCR